MKACGIRLVAMLILVFVSQASAQSAAVPEDAAPLVLTGAVPLSNVQGRIAEVLLYTVQD
jgi:hypothetical protein